MKIMEFSLLHVDLFFHELKLTKHLYSLYSITYNVLLKVNYWGGVLTSVQLNCILPNSALKSLSQHACIWRKGMSGGDKFKYHKNGVLYNRNGGLIRGRRDIRALSLFLVRTWREGGYLQTGKRTLTRNWTPPEREFPATRNVRRYISLFNLSSLLYLQPEQTKTTSNTMCLFFF